MRGEERGKEGKREKERERERERYFITVGIMIHVGREEEG